MMRKNQAVLNHQQAMRVTKSGLLRDGNGLYLQISRQGVKSWIIRYMIDGRARYMGIGPFPVVSLAQAREKSIEIRRIIRLDGLDPLELRHSNRLARKLELAKSITFKACAEKFILTNRASWKNDKHAWQWTRTLEHYAYPTIGDLSVAEIDTTVLLKVLLPIWNTATVTATRVRGRIERIVQYAITAGFRQGDNPARWKGHLENLLPKPSRVAKVRNQPALPWAHIPGFMARLRKIDSIPARALEFTILVAARSGETLGARWSELDLDERLWTVPPERIKSKREHRVPLSDRAVKILAMMSLWSRDDDGFVFPGAKAGQSLSNMSMLMLLRRMGRHDITTHGFRSTFRDWTAETTNTTREVAEMALAHVIPSKVEAAYRRGDLLEKRRALMGDWAAYCQKEANAVAMVSKGASSSDLLVGGRKATAKLLRLTGGKLVTSEAKKRAE
jgi:integrase